ncbi:MULTISPECIES: helix-turn-helix transcriptional regulator [unclassified Adlercreutzia]|uniref:helix-turn-helix transcriptional regulator n=1 Tax=unclassified Adlercreutzia TaxID=2636013 RepID=UPI0013EAEDB1|nr:MULTISPECIES: helix-turn-helix transcriptional regulator [unclassified Adlercreutzia]
MEVGKTIRDLRAEAGMSQEELAGKAFVSRQTISNWENDKSYPDVQSLGLIAGLFGTSIDALAKGDLPMIDARIAEEDVRELKRNAALYGVLLAVSLVVMVVAFAQDNWLALATGALVYALSLYFAFLVERGKRKYEVQTYREIRAFCGGASLDEIKARRAPERLCASVMRKVLVGGCAGAAVGLVTAGIVRLL